MANKTTLTKFRKQEQFDKVCGPQWSMRATRALGIGWTSAAVSSGGVMELLGLCLWVQGVVCRFCGFPPILGVGAPCEFQHTLAGGEQVGQAQVLNSRLRFLARPP